MSGEPQPLGDRTGLSVHLSMKHVTLESLECGEQTRGKVTALLPSEEAPPLVHVLPTRELCTQRPLLGSLSDAGTGHAAHPEGQPSSSQKATDRRTSKKFKYDKGHLVKSEFQKPIPQSDRTAVPTATPETPGQREPLASAEDRARLPGKEASGSTPQGTAALPRGHCGAMSDACPVETEDRPPPPRCGAPVGGESDGGCPERDGAAADPEQSHTPPLQMDNSVLLDDDSNQPMPVSRFFGNVELMQLLAEDTKAGD
ncbi:hypothetical protein BU61_3792 [Pontoporia blainvillei]|uniref:Uncharacterized protein n=1 Tax=Pontoporia blainvillei TaxID=48723 RepID=A0ABX0S4R6_PONBL|nr:hypothetical protein [Pontoporia blainvillei]